MQNIKFIAFLILFSSLDVWAQDVKKEETEFIIMDEVPVFPGCKGDRKTLKKCFNKEIQMHFMKKFNIDLVNQLDLNPGKIKIFLGFRVNREGNIDSINVKAPHRLLIKECEKVISSLPKMIPGKTHGKNISVKYSIPFTMFVEETKAQKKSRRKQERLDRIKNN